MSPIFIVVGSQVLFSISDVMGRYFMSKKGFHAVSFLSIWFLLYFTLRNFAAVGQLYVFSSIELGRTLTLFAIASLVVGNMVGLVFLKESISLITYFGIMLAILAFLLIGYYGKA